MTSSHSRSESRGRTAKNVYKGILFTGVTVFAVGLLVLVLHLLEEPLSWGWYDDTNWGTAIMWMALSVGGMILAALLMLVGGIGLTSLKRR